MNKVYEVEQNIFLAYYDLCKCIFKRRNEKNVFLSHETVYNIGALAYNGKMLLYSVSQSLEKL